MEASAGPNEGAIYKPSYFGISTWNNVKGEIGSLCRYNEPLVESSVLICYPFI